MISGRPELTVAEAARSFAEVFGFTPSSCKALPGERDLNFRIGLSDGRQFVFKLCNQQEPSEYFDAQEAALHRLRDLPFVPRPLPGAHASGKREVTVDDQVYRVRAVTYQTGKPLAAVGRPSNDLLTDLGQKLAAVDVRLENFDVPILRRRFDWNLLEGCRVVEDTLTQVTEPRMASMVQASLERAAACLALHHNDLRQSAIHNDANDHNLIVGVERDEEGEFSLSGLIDFGDLAWSYLVAELAIAAAYIVCRRDDPVTAISHLVAGYHQRLPLEPAELACLLDLTMLRMSVSICMSARQQQQRPDDEYLSISQEPIRATLPRLLELPSKLVLAQIREACGMPPHDRSRIVVEWVAEHADDFFPVMGRPLVHDECDVLDLSVGNPEIALSSTESDNESGAWQPNRFAIGRYDEPRLIYQSELFQESSGRQRTIHLGVDVSAPAGTPVFAPLDGEIVVSTFRDFQQDYGGVIVLRHEPLTGLTFYTLYGHLSRDSVVAWEPNARVGRGDQLARLGPPQENGGWPPHLHLQLIVDLLDLGDAFPGVALADERHLWTSLSPDPRDLVGMDKQLKKQARCYPVEDTLPTRKRLLGSNLSLSYRSPIHLSRGWMQYLFDAEGRRFLDAYNNVPHVGHGHPRVIEAAYRQMRLLNTNSRYLQEVVHRYLERLLELLPPSLEVGYLLNSASEANELAIRLARQSTGRQAVIVQEAAYHGHTNTLIDISPYKHNGPGGSGAPDWVHQLPLPDTFRGRFRGPDAGRRYSENAEQYIRALATHNHPAAAFIAETYPSVGGQIIPPVDYLPNVYEAIREHGGLAIADEVQTGFGRIGSHFWAFESYGVTPDIVVMGKPMGNGHPLAAVVTTRAVAQAFDNGMEFFSTFGGNSVSAAVGLAVLDVLRDEQLPAKALETGKVLESGLEALRELTPLIGQVRGRGLFWGLDLVRDANALTPASTEARLIVNRLRDQGILIGTDGQDANVLKIRPPMPFDSTNAKQLLESLRNVLQDEFPSI